MNSTNATWNRHGWRTCTSCRVRFISSWHHSSSPTGSAAVITHSIAGSVGCVATAGMISGVFALIFGGLFSFGGLPQASAAVLFGLWFLTCLVLAVRAIRRDDIVHHRRWMIRAFAIGIGIGTIRIWLALLQIVGVGEASSFGPAFWISFPLHVVAGELWLRAFPNPPELAHESQSSTPSPRRAAAEEPAG